MALPHIPAKTYFGPQWEYYIHILMGANENDLNKLGRDGWELVSVTSPSEDEYAMAYLKRRLLS